MLSDPMSFIRNMLRRTGEAAGARSGQVPPAPGARRALTVACVALTLIALSLAGCGTSHGTGTGDGTSTSQGTSTTAPPSTGTATAPRARPHVIEPAAGQQAAATTPSALPVGDVHAHAPPIAQVEAALRQEVIAARVSSTTYINPLRFVTVWERTDQGVDANLPVGAPILAPGRVKILDIEPDWYLNQPLVYYELLDGPDAGKVQYVAEEITDIARPGSILQQGQVIARYAAAGTGIEYGWSTLNGTTLAVATGGYEEGQITPAGRWMRAWLNSLGANAGPDT